MKSQKGITLIALVITIIVMMILVAVTISVSLNGGLFITAKESTTQMDIEQEKEELLMVAMGALGENGKVDFNKLDNNLPDNFTKITDKTYESSTENKYQVSENGSIILLDGNIEETPETPETPEIQAGTIPEGGTYTIKETGEVLTEGDNFPEHSNIGDKYQYGDYNYVLRAEGDISSSVLNACAYGWAVGINTSVTDKNQETYGTILTSINNVNTTNLIGTFSFCKNLKYPPTIPETVVVLDDTFYGTAITSETAPQIPQSVRYMLSTFMSCTQLTYAPTLPNNLIVAHSIFMNCSNLVSAPVLPSTVEITQQLFQGCVSLNTYQGSTDSVGDFSNYIIPDSTYDMPDMFYQCSSITYAPKKLPSTIERCHTMFGGCLSLKCVPVVTSTYTNEFTAFSNCPSLVTYYGNEDGDGDFSNYPLPNSRTFSFYNCQSIVKMPMLPESAKFLNSAFKNCISMTSAPVIPKNVETMYNTFDGCTSLEGNVTINATYVPVCGECFANTTKEIVLIGSSSISTRTKLAATATNGNVTVGE